MIYDEPIPEIRAIDQPYAALAGAVCEMAVHDLLNPNTHTRRTATAFVRAGTFSEWLEYAGLDVSADACRAALRASGRLPQD
jgi:hypothetical protein